MMRRSLLLIASAVVLVLSGCASTSPEWSSSTDARRDPRAAKAPRVDLSKQSVSSIMAPSNDLWIQIRQGFALPELDSPLVEQQTQWLMKRPDYVDRSMARSSRYLFYIVEEVNRRNMPTEIALLPFVESAFNPEAKSTSKAMGIWQFMPRTGQDFKLTQNVFRDERRDVLQSTNAALDYLQRLYKQFGDWQLALAAYNWGEGNVARAIKRNQAQRKPTDYQSLTMPRETREYVPKLMAYKNIVQNPGAYNIVLPELENHPYFVAIDVTRDIDVDVAAQLAEMSLEDFRNLNPAFNKPVILAATDQQMLLPFARAELFQMNLAGYNKPLSSWTALKITKSETPEQLASRLALNPETIRDVNNIPRGMRIRAGSTVLIPKPPGKESDISEYLAEHGQLKLDKAAPPKPKTSKPARASAANKSAPKKVANPKTASTQQKSPSTNTAKSAKTGTTSGSGVSASVKTAP
ncbi:transglycosylase SLT domain-containing protein [Polynucleobacter sp. HIN5]|uniref:transglycosylase SLT domain-containing protein n=1 Tax=Polynucleobacter sp. HIN5 TaxID=3047864 RepID=UPI002572E3EC|nr:transglycosylase SLT domain-containing protein [Polynucleobacter sp. HIN5]BEI33865.1 transglycosylase SLT domain-containing protein [Polynucleobacter sp. HIN5]